jgi:hypothetical protein
MLKRFDPLMGPQRPAASGSPGHSERSVHMAVVDDAASQLPTFGEFQHLTARAIANPSRGARRLRVLQMPMRRLRTGRRERKTTRHDLLPKKNVMLPDEVAR